MLRSPTGSDRAAGLGGSHPNLVSASNSLQDSLANDYRVTMRSKRKKTDDDSGIKDELSEIKKQLSIMMEMISLQNQNQKESIDKVSEDIKVIKNEIMDIKDVTKKLTDQQIMIQSDLQCLKTKSTETEKKIQDIESVIAHLSSQEPSLSTAVSVESMLMEMKEREERSKNLIIVGIPEQSYENREEKKVADINDVLRITRTIDPTCPEPDNIIRLGKYSSAKKSRPIKVFYNSNSIVKCILRNKNILTSDNVRLFSDQTRQQQEYMKNLRNELRRQIDGGEKDLVIKYVKGIPKIVKQSPKN